MGAVKDWHPNVAQVEVLTPSETGVGAARRVEFHDGNGVVETVVEESERRFTKVEMTESPLLRDAFVTFAIDYSVTLGPIGWLIDVVMMRRVFRNVFDVALGGLSYHLETGELVTDSIPDPKAA